MTTMRDVAQKAGTSVATVSAVINGTARVSPRLSARVRNAIREVDYLPNDVARSLRKGATRMIALVIPGILNPVFAEIAQTIETTATRNGYAIFLCNASEDLIRQDEYLKFIRSMRVAGVIIVPAAGSDVDAAVLRDMVAAPVVILDRAGPDIDADTVVVDNAEAAERAVSYLITLGHRRIGAVVSFPDSYTSRERLRGYKNAMKEAGLKTGGDLIREGCSTVERARAAVVDMMQGPDRPTALFATFEHAGMGIVQALNQLGLKWPDDVSFITFDGIAWADAIDPSATRIRQPAEMMGNEAVRLLLERIEGNSEIPARRLVLPTEFILRDSCKALRT